MGFVSQVIGIYNKFVHHISIIIVNYNSAPLTTSCLRSLKQVKVQNAEIKVIVVDNGSSVPYQLSLAYEDMAVLVRSGSNLGFTGGNNLGIHQAIEEYNSDFILLLNNDATMSSTALQLMVNQALADETVGVVTPKIFFTAGREFHFDSYEESDRGKVLWFGGGSIDWQNLFAFHRGVDEVDHKHIESTTDIDFATGCCMLIKREVLEKIGLLDKRYFLYYEDVELSRKVRSFNYKLSYCAEAIVWHENAGSSDGAGSVTHQYYQTRNRLLFFWEYGTTRTKMTVIKLLLRLLFSKNKMERRGAEHFIRRQFGKQPIL